MCAVCPRSQAFATVQLLQFLYTANEHSYACMSGFLSLDFTQFWKLGKAYKIKLKWSGMFPWIEVSFTLLLILE